MVTRFEVLLEIHSPDGQAVSFKQDGKRFEESTTVKLCVDEKYHLRLRFRPAFKLEAWHIQDDGLTFSEEVPPLLPGKKDQDMAAYSAVWNTKGFKVTPNGERFKLRIHLELEDDQVLETSMQVKFYSRKKSTACKWGQPMHVLDLSCHARPGDHYVTVRRGSIL